MLMMITCFTSQKLPKTLHDKLKGWPGTTHQVCDLDLSPTRMKPAKDTSTNSKEQFCKIF